MNVLLLLHVTVMLLVITHVAHIFANANIVIQGMARLACGTEVGSCSVIINFLQWLTSHSYVATSFDKKHGRKLYMLFSG